MKTEHLKKKLEAEKAKLEAEMQNIGRKSATVPDDWESAPIEESGEADTMDQADVIANRDNSNAVLADLEARYDTILSALASIERGTYGKCEVCGKPIEEARLEANPSATTCSAHMG